MKASEKIFTPEKIYIPMSRYWYGIDSVFYPVRQHKNDTEYIRTDAFIEKAVSYIQQHWIWNTKIIEEFRKYMKGE